MNSVGSSSEQTPPKTNNSSSSNNNHTTTTRRFFPCQTILERDVVVESPSSSLSSEKERHDALDRENNHFFPKIFAAEVAGGCSASATVIASLERVETVSISNLHLL